MAPVTAGIVFGIAGPLIAAATSWLVVDRVYRRSATAVTPTLIQAWAAKVVFFVAYVTVVMKGLDVSPVPFVSSFTASFIAFYAIEAVLLHRLFSRAWRGVR